MKSSPSIWYYVENIKVMVKRWRRFRQFSWSSQKILTLSLTDIIFKLLGRAGTSVLPIRLCTQHSASQKSLKTMSDKLTLTKNKLALFGCNIRGYIFDKIQVRSNHLTSVTLCILYIILRFFAKQTLETFPHPEYEFH